MSNKDDAIKGFSKMIAKNCAGLIETVIEERVGVYSEHLVEAMYKKNKDNKPSEQSIEKAAQCWCDEETKHIEMNSDLALAFAKRLDDITIEQAMNRLKRAMKEEPDYAYSWHANISMSCVDSMILTKRRLPLDSTSDYQKAGNEAATRFMKECFNAETSLYMLEKLEKNKQP